MRIQRYRAFCRFPARKEDISYKIAAIDIHKRVLMVVVASVAGEVADATGAAVEFELRRFGTGASERNHLVRWLQQHQVREVVMESTAQYWKPVWLDLALRRIIAQDAPRETGMLGGYYPRRRMRR